MTDQQAQVWTEDRFIAALSEHSEAHKNDWNAALELGWKIICEYEAALAKANQQRDEALAQVTELERQLAHCQQAATALAMLSDDETITETWFPDEENDDD